MRGRPSSEALKAQILALSKSMMWRRLDSNVWSLARFYRCTFASWTKRCDVGCWWREWRDRVGDWSQSPPRGSTPSTVAILLQTAKNWHCTKFASVHDRFPFLILLSWSKFKWPSDSDWERTKHCDDCRRRKLISSLVSFQFIYYTAICSHECIITIHCSQCVLVEFQSPEMFCILLYFQSSLVFVNNNAISTTARNMSPGRHACVDRGEKKIYLS
jgi:hypothetical protein